MAQNPFLSQGGQRAQDSSRPQGFGGAPQSTTSMGGGGPPRGVGATGFSGGPATGMHARPAYSSGMQHSGPSMGAFGAGGGGARPPMTHSGMPGGMGGPPTGMGGPMTSGGMGGPPTGMGGPPTGMGGPMTSGGMGGPPTGMGGPMTSGGMGGPPTGMGGPPTGMGGPPTGMGGPMTSGGMGGPPTGMGGMSGPMTSGGMGGPPTGMGGPPTGMSGPMTSGGIGGPPMSMGGAMGGGAQAPPSQAAVPFFNPMSSGGGAPVPDEFGGSGSYDPNSGLRGGVGGPSTMGIPGAPRPPPTQAVPMAEVNEELNCDDGFMQVTTRAMPINDSLRRQSGIPVGVCVHPLAELPGMDEPPLVDFGETGVVRCKRCRAYINPFVQFTDGGRVWKCNICNFVNDVAAGYFSGINDQGVRHDADRRPELSQGSVEIVAPAEYMVRAPQPPVYVFVIDVSYQAVSSEMLSVAAAAIKDALDDIGDGRTQVGFITFDSAVHFFRISTTRKSHDILSVSDLSEIFVPAPEDLLVNLQENREAVENLLDSLPSMYAEARNPEACLGSALRGAYAIMQQLGGKMIVLQSCLPTVGEGKLRPREAPRMLGSPEEHKLLAPDNSSEGMHYRNLAMEFSRQQISVDMFLFSPNYTDVASIAALARFTAGQTYYYPGFSAAMDGGRFHGDLVHDLTRTTGFEAVMRVRCSAGMRMRNFFGNFFIRGHDLLTMPNVTSDTACCVELEHASTLEPGSLITIQAALLYTTGTGQRRIRVHNMAVPVTSSIKDVFHHADVDTVANMIAKQALDVALRRGLMQSRTSIHNSVVDIVRAHHMLQSREQKGPSAERGHAATSLPENMALLPLYGLALQKSVLFRGGANVRSDERAALVYRMLGMPVTLSTPFLYPRVFALHALGKSEGLPVEGGDEAAEEDEDQVAGFARIRLPECVGASQAQLRSDGIFLLDDGVESFIWIGEHAPGHMVESLLGMPSIAGLDCSTIPFPLLETDLSQRTHNILQALSDTGCQLPRVRVVRQGANDGLERRFLWRLVEDAQEFPVGSVAYPDYVVLVSRDAVTGNPSGPTM